MKRKFVFKLTITSVFAVLLLIWGISLIWCELLTKQHYDEFKDAYRSNSMLGEMAYFKVLSCTDTQAKVYYVSEGKTEADVLTFKKEGNVWEESHWDTIWSISGSASGVQYPYIWHFVYGGF